MAIEERLRHNIHSKFSEILGPEEVDAVMTHMMQVPWRDVATKDDLRVLSAEIQAELHREIGGVRAELHQTIVGQTRWLTGYVTALGVVMLTAARLIF